MKDRRDRNGTRMRGLGVSVLRQSCSNREALQLMGLKERPHGSARPVLSVPLQPTFLSGWVRPVFRVQTQEDTFPLALRWGELSGERT